MTEDSFYTEIQNSINNARAFVTYHIPGTDKVNALIQNDDKRYTLSSSLDSGFVFAPFSPREEWILIPKSESYIRSFPIKANPEPVESLSESIIEYTATESNRYKKLVRKARDAIVNSELQKVVLSRPIDLKCEATAISLFRQMLSQYPDTMTYLFYHPKVGTWLGASPEQLINVDRNKLTTVSLAGTRWLLDEEVESWTEKELKEQKYVTDYLVEELRPYVRDILKSEVESVRAGSVMHLKTGIQAELLENHTNLADILMVIHPTPAVCGTPKDLAREFILAEEGYDREYYTGFLGELNMKGARSANLFVNLRCMQLLENHARVYVGGGITAESDPDSEWVETVEKSKTMVKVIGFSSPE